MFLSLLRADDNGQYIPTISVEIRFFNILAVRRNAVEVEITHLDGGMERLLINERLDGYIMQFGEERNVYQISVVPFPTSGQTLSKDEWQQRIKPLRVADRGDNLFRNFV